MLRKRSLSNYSNSNTSDNNDEEHEQDTVSVVTSEADSEHDEVVLAEDDAQKDHPTFGNIAVKNSTDIHFGNKTYYQGPVTIKQILYANSQTSCDDSEKLAITNNSLILDGVPAISSLGKTNPTFAQDNGEIRIKSGTDKVNVEAQHAPVVKGTRWLHKISRQHILLITSLAAVLLVSLVTLMVVLLTRHSPVVNNIGPQYPDDGGEQDGGEPPVYPTDPNVNLTLPPKLKIIPRSEWLAQPPIDVIPRLVIPIPFVVISHTATDSCMEQAICKSVTRDLQTYHIEAKGYNDIAYNFLVGGDGYAYQGRGWKYEGAHTFGYNSKSIGIAFIGAFHKKMPNHYQILAAKQLIEQGVESGYIISNYKLFGEKQLQDTSSPGTVLFEEIKTWPHWTNKTFNP